MTFQKAIPINVTGPSYQSRSRPLSSQQTKNWYQQIVEEGKDNYVLHSFPGLKSFGSVSAGVDRGMRNFGEIGYRIVGTTLYSFNSSGTHTTIGTIPGSNRMIMDDDGNNLIITGVDGQFIYDNSSIEILTDSNIAGSTANTFLKNSIIYTNDPFFVVASSGTPDTVNGLNAATPESKPDALVRAYAFKQNVYMFGTRSTEPYWFSGQGNTPLDVLDGQIFEVGLEAIHSVANTDKFLYWLGDDNAVYQAVGGQRQRVSSTAISHAIDGYSVTDDAVGYTFTMEGMNFYAIHFPTADKSWCLNETYGDKGWFEISSGTSGGIYQGTSLINVYGKNLVADATNGNLYELDLDTYTNNGEVIQRRRITSSVNGKLLGSSGSRVQWSRLEVIMEQGVGLISGQGENPKIQLDISFDGGRSWAEKGWGRIGRMGEHTLKVEFFGLDTGYDFIFRLTTSDPVSYELYSAAIDLRLAGK